jgi:VanZ family protein
MIPRIFQVLFFALLLIATQQSLTPKPANIFEPIWDKYLHLASWGGLALVLYGGYRTSVFLRLKWLGLFFYSIAIEVGQIFVPGRMFSKEDIVANGLGIMLAAGLIKISEKYVPLSKVMLK